MSRRLLLSYVFFVVFVLAALEIPLGVSYAHNERSDLETKVERDVVALGALAEDGIERGAAADATLSALARQYARDTGARAVIVDRSGRSLGDSADTAGRSFASRPEIARALRGEVVSGVRRSDTLGTNLLYVAGPIASGGVVRGAVRITYPTSAVDSRIRHYWLTLAAIAGVVLAVGAAVGLAVARSIARPLRRLEASAAAAGGGDLGARAATDAGPKEVRTLATVFNDTVAKLDELLREQREFAADASHQLRTPLTALRLRLENLGRDVAPEGRSELDGALAEVDRMSRLVGALLVLARAENGAATAGAVDVDDALADRLAAWSALARERGVLLTLDAAGAPPVRTTAERLTQVLDNLIENALHATSSGGTVALSATGANGTVELHVVDDGSGMSADQRARAFDRFWSGRAGNGGSGLGLAVARRLAASDGGDVVLRAAPAGGLDACVRLPAAR